MKGTRQEYKRFLLQSPENWWNKAKFVSGKCTSIEVQGGVLKSGQVLQGFNKLKFECLCLKINSSKITHFKGMRL